ncbi:MAG: YceI family protein [Acidobacteriota bacterium]|nr:YceI family protein [Acidobacteriota bacterium]
MATDQQTVSATLVPAGEWQLDPAHTSAGFRIRKLFWHPKGRFRDVSARLRATEQTLELTGSARVASITTGIPPRDLHLRSAHFFAARRHPTVELEISEATRISGDAYRLLGELTLKGVTRPVELIAAAHAHGDHVHVHAEGSVDRHAHGLVAPAFVELGGFLLGREVELVLDARFQRVG